MKTIQATRLDQSAARAVAPRVRAPPLRVAAAAGFGAAADKPAAAKKPAKKNFKLERLLAEEPTLYTPGAAAVVSEGAADEAWFAVPGVDAKATFLSKPVKAVILPTGRAICLYKPPGGDAIFCSDAESTAYRYPLADASLLLVNGKPAVSSAASLVGQLKQKISQKPTNQRTTH
jgi:hypothetical protein